MLLQGRKRQERGGAVQEKWTRLFATEVLAGTGNPPRGKREGITDDTINLGWLSYWLGSCTFFANEGEKGAEGQRGGDAGHVMSTSSTRGSGAVQRKSHNTTSLWKWRKLVARKALGGRNTREITPTGGLHFPSCPGNGTSKNASDPCQSSLELIFLRNKL